MKTRNYEGVFNALNEIKENYNYGEKSNLIELASKYRFSNTLISFLVKMEYLVNENGLYRVAKKIDRNVLDEAWDKARNEQQGFKYRSRKSMSINVKATKSQTAIEFITPEPATQRSVIRVIAPESYKDKVNFIIEYI